MMTGAVVAAPFRVAVIDMGIQPSSSGVLKLLVSDGAKRHALLHFARPLVFQNGVVFFAFDMGPLEPDERVVFRMVHNHLTNRVYNMHLHDFYFSFLIFVFLHWIIFSVHCR